MLRLLAPLFLLTGAAAPAPESAGARVDAAAREAMQATGAHGLAVALIEDGRPVAVRVYGKRNAVGEPLTTGTVMYGASLTKAVFAQLVMQLVDEGRVDLDKPIAAMLPKPLPEYGNLDDHGNWGDLAGDERWRITSRHVLTHSTGWANFAFLEPGRKAPVPLGSGQPLRLFGRGDQPAPVRDRGRARAEDRGRAAAADLPAARHDRHAADLAAALAGEARRRVDGRGQDRAA